MKQVQKEKIVWDSEEGEKLRECTNPECRWVGSRSQALGPYSRPGSEGKNQYWKCPECLVKIESDNKWGPRLTKTFDEDEPLKKKILFCLLHDPGSTVKELVTKINPDLPERYSESSHPYLIRRSTVRRKLVKLKKEEKVYHLGRQNAGRGDNTKWFLESKFLVRETVKDELGIANEDIVRGVGESEG